MYISPRLRAQRTYELLFGDSIKGSGAKEGEEGERVQTTEALAEWDYGLYEGLLTKEIRKARKEKGLDGEREWDIWRDGCEGGE